MLFDVFGIMILSIIMLYAKTQLQIAENKEVRYIPKISKSSFEGNQQLFYLFTKIRYRMLFNTIKSHSYTEATARESFFKYLRIQSIIALVFGGVSIVVLIFDMFFDFLIKV